MSQDATTATPPDNTPVTSTPPVDVSAATPPVAIDAQPTAAVVSPELTAFQTETAQTIQELREQVAALAPKSAPTSDSPHQTQSHVEAIAKFGDDVNPDLLRQFVDNDLSVRALDYQIVKEADPATRASLERQRQQFAGKRTNAEGQILFRKREAQINARDAKKNEKPTPANGDVSTIPMDVLRNEGQVMPLIASDAPLLAAAIRTGQITYNDVLNRIVDQENDPGSQWISVVQGLNDDIRRGVPLTNATPGQPASPQTTVTPIAGMPPAGGAQSGTPQPSQNDRERQQRDADAVARMRAAKG